MKTAFIFLLCIAGLNASEVETMVTGFYAKGALEIRGTVDQKEVETALASLTPSFRAAIVTAQRTVEEWRKAAKRNPEIFRDLKPPPGEGPLFTSVYEGGRFTKIENARVAGDRAYVTVRVAGLVPANSDYSWTDILILHQVDGKWMIDDILSNSGSGRPTSIRYRHDYPKPPTAEQASGGNGGQRR
ncbi:MAG: hypothetical protein V4819_24090 [Verrucomicrobiota bacterium]